MTNVEGVMAAGDVEGAAGGGRVATEAEASRVSLLAMCLVHQSAPKRFLAFHDLSKSVNSMRISLRKIAKSPSLHRASVLPIGQALKRYGDLLIEGRRVRCHGF